MTTQELINIAKENHLEVIFHGNKYDKVATGFKNYEEAKEFAEKYESNLYLIDIQPNAEFYTEAYPKTEKIDTSWLRSIFVDEEIEEVKSNSVKGRLFISTTHTSRIFNKST